MEDVESKHRVCYTHRKIKIDFFGASCNYHYPINEKRM